MTAHTPGPWRVCFDSCGKYSKEGECEGGWAVDGPRWQSNHGFVEADARLIAAAPELVEALRSLIAVYDKVGGPLKVDPAIARAREVLARLEVKP